MGNICRSPTAEGVFRHKVRAAGLIDHVAIDSAGTHNYHLGEPSDARSQHHTSLERVNNRHRSNHLPVLHVFAVQRFALRECGCGDDQPVPMR